ncbi:MAG: hypothetical protein IJ309_00480 [Clostridia bacterium]|nr:hypothetical protein [Clostridia bacterium]
MKKRILLVLSMVAILACVLAISVSAARVEDYNDTYTLVGTTNIQQLFRRYTTETAYSTEWYTDTITVKFVDENGNEIAEVPLWEYDETECKYYSLIWYISNWEFTTEKEDVTYSEVTTQRDKYISAVYTLSSARAVDLRFDTSYSENKSFSTSSVGYDYSLTVSKPLWGIYYDVNSTPDDTTDDLILQRSTGMGRDKNDYGNIGFEAQFASIGNKIVVANFRDCTGEDFDADCTGNYSTKTTWYLATNLQCLHYHDGFKYMVGGIGPAYEIDLGEGIEVINCQLLRDNKRVKSVVLPNSLIYLGGESFRGSVVKTIVIGEGLLYAPSNVCQWKDGGFENMYVSKNILTKYLGYVTKHENNGSSLLNPASSANIYFDGNLEEATALMNKMISENSSWKESSFTLCDYNEITERGDLKNTVIFYNYNRCDAFYRGQHTETGEYTKTWAGEKFLSQCAITSDCTVCKMSNLVETLAPLFYSNGYSSSEGADSVAMMQSFGINFEVLGSYKTYYGDIKFGLVAAYNGSGSGFDNTSGQLVTSAGVAINNKVAIVDFTERGYDLFEMKIAGITSEHQNKEFYISAYVIENSNVHYIDDGRVNETAKAIKYADIKATLPEYDYIVPLPTEEVA